MAGHRMRDYYPRTVPWSLVAAVWKNLAAGLRVHCGRPMGHSVAWVDPQEKICHMLRCLEDEGWVPDQLRAGEIWVRWGADGVPLWGRSYLTLTVSVGNLGARTPLLRDGPFRCVPMPSMTP